jgi:hypothetical protein
MRTLNHLAACLLLAVSTPSMANEHRAAFGAPLSCADRTPSSVLALTQELPGFSASIGDLAWALVAMDRIGFKATPPAGAAGADAAMRASTLLRRGNLVAAKMANDEALSSVPGYKSEQFSSSFESLLTVLTQPVRHASYPQNVRAEGEEWPSDVHHGHSHGVDMEQSSAALIEVISRVAVAQRALGETYRRPAVRYYILANGFRDDVALRAATAAVCKEKLEASAKSKLNIAARFVSMPSQVALERTKQ